MTIVAKALFFLGLVLLGTCPDTSAVDTSICNPGARMIFDVNGTLRSCRLKNNYKANNVLCHGGDRINFYEDGSLESCVLSEPVALAGSRCGEFYWISFYPDGTLQSCVKSAN